MMDECIISAKEILNAVHKDLGDGIIQICDFNIKPASDEKLGLTGDHVRITVNAIHDGKDKILKYFAKKIPTEVQAHREYAERVKAFYKEIELYKTLFDDMQQAVSPQRRNIKWRPDCYHTRDWDLLIVEDLALKGFYMLPDRKLMPLEYMKAALSVMARMHAGSFIFEEKLKRGECNTKSLNKAKDGEITRIGDLYPNLIFETECTDEDGHPGFAFWETGIRGQEAIIELLPGYTEKEKKNIKDKFGETVRQVYRMLEPSKKYRNVMIHADLWGNNLLFRDGPDGKVAEAITVDFQMTRYAPPAQDVFMLFHITQDKPFRDKYEAELIDYYYKALTEELTAENLKIENLLPRKEFDESCIFYKRYAILNQMIYTQLNLTPPELSNDYFETSEKYEKVMKVDRSELLVKSFLTDDMCRERATESMNEIIQVFGLV